MVASSSRTVTKMRERRPSPVTISVMLLLLLLLVLLSSLDIIILEECQALLLSRSNHLRGRLPRSSHIPTNRRRRVLLNSTATAEKATSTTKNRINPITETREERSNDYISSSSSNDEIRGNNPETTIETPILGVEEVGHAFYRKLSELDAYIQLHGHCRVPKRYAPNPSLGNWVNKQRQQYKKYMALGGVGKGGGDHGSDVKTSMNETRIKALNQRNFIWDATTTTKPSTPESTSTITTSAYDDTSWQRMYNQLEQYYTIHKHCNVPSTTSLGQWVVRQRFHYRRKQQLTNNNECRVRMLNELNFTWPTYSERIWELRIQQLREFASIYGHVCVPRSYTANPSLGPWVATQRKYYNIYLSHQQQQQQQHQQNGSGVLGGGERVGGGLDGSKKIRMTSRCPLTKERINQLDEMGFVWSYWDYKFQQEG